MNIFDLKVQLQELKVSHREEQGMRQVAGEALTLNDGTWRARSGAGVHVG